MSENEKVLRTIGSWRQFFKSDKKKCHVVGNASS